MWPLCWLCFGLCAVSAAWAAESVPGAEFATFGRQEAPPVPHKRYEPQEPDQEQDQEAQANLPQISHGLASQLMLRSARSQRQYDVPQIECPPAMDGMERFACPTPDRQGRYRCIDDHVLCDGFVDCPEGEDEDRQACMFYKTTKAHLDVLADALLRWARGR